MDFITRQLENKRLPFFNNSFGQTYISTDTRDRQKSFRNWMMRTWWPTRSRCVNVKEMAAFRCLSVESKNTDKDNVPTTTRIHKKDRGKTKSWQKKMSGISWPERSGKKHVVVDNTPCLSWERNVRKKETTWKGERLKNPHDSYSFFRPSPNKK